MHKQLTRALAFALAFAGVAAMRPAEAVVYHGSPDLQLTVDLVKAGTTPAGKFDSTLMFKNLYGAQTPAEAAKLTAAYGKAGVGDFFKLMDHSIDFVLAAVTADKVKLPKPTAGITPAELATKLRAAGKDPKGKYDVGFMIEKLISHPYHKALMADLDKTYAHQQVAVFHEVLGEAVKDSGPQ